ncbi:MAG: agmatinase [Syntrophobacterales bacterium]|nr:MAG: agmatinase [Syntrophobacterales bacterium]
MTDFLQNHFLSADSQYEQCDVCIVGLPYDGTSSFRPGSRFGPNAIRKASWGMETYSPNLQRDLSDLKICDLGDLEIPFGNKEMALAKIREAIGRIIDDGKYPVLLGGEHLITLPIVEGFRDRFHDLAVVQLDAHIDLRDEYLGETLSHSTVMRRVLEVIGAGGLFQFGIRSGSREEFSYANTIGSLYEFSEDGLHRAMRTIGNKPLYISLDLDVLDPSILPGTGNPEPGGINFNEMIRGLQILGKAHVIGFDVVELSPGHDPSEVSSIVASQLIREMILNYWSK